MSIVAQLRKGVNWRTGLLLAILCLSAGLSLTGITWGLPNANHSHTYQADESAYITMLRHMNPRALNFDPGTFKIGTGVPYTMAAGMVVASGVGWLHLTTDADYYFKHPDEWAKFYLIGRLVSVAFAMLCPLWMYLILKELYGEKPWIPLLGAFWSAVLPGLVINAHFLSYNVPAVAWSGLACWLLLRLSRTRQRRYYVLAGLAIGVGMAYRYTVASWVPFLTLAHVLGQPEWRTLQFWKIGKTWGDLLLGNGCIGVSFLALTPYSLLQFPDFISQNLWALRYTTPLGMPLGDRVYNLWIGGFLPIGLGWGLYLLGLAGLAWRLLKRGKQSGELLVWLWLLLSLVVAQQANTPVIGRILPILYFLLVPAAALAGDLWQWFAGRRQRRLLCGVWLAIVVLISLMSLGESLRADAHFLTDTVRAEASTWIVENIPPGTTLGLFKGPYWDTPDIVTMDYNHPELTGGRYIYTICENDASAFIAQPAEYLILTPRRLVSVDEACTSILDAYDQVAYFGPAVPLGQFSLSYQLHSATEIRILRRRS